MDLEIELNESVTSHLATRKTRHQQTRHQYALKVATKTSYLATMHF